MQEMIDICDFAVGLSRQLYGLTIASERPGHRLTEQWHPLGPVGVITAFNFPVAVWAWNAMLALVCGDPVVWKPSEKDAAVGARVPRARRGSAAASIARSARRGSSSVVDRRRRRRPGACRVAASCRSSRRPARCAMGRAVAQTVAARLGRSLLELGGNNAMIVAPSADLELAVRAIVFAAAGTARPALHDAAPADRARKRSRPSCRRPLARAFYARFPIGDPRDAGMLVGPLIDEHAFDGMQRALDSGEGQGGKVHGGGERVTSGVPAGGVVRAARDRRDRARRARSCREETFAPILYVMRYRLARRSDRASTTTCRRAWRPPIFTDDVREAELFCSAVGSDCGIANVNIGTSGAEIGGAFGGEKDTGGGRESGSDAWKAYMRRATNTVNYGDRSAAGPGHPLRNRLTAWNGVSTSPAQPRKSPRPSTFL